MVRSSEKAHTGWKSSSLFPDWLGFSGWGPPGKAGLDEKAIYVRGSHPVFGCQVSVCLAVFVVIKDTKQ